MNMSLKESCIILDLAMAAIFFLFVLSNLGGELSVGVKE